MTRPKGRRSKVGGPPAFRPGAARLAPGRLARRRLISTTFTAPGSMEAIEAADALDVAKAPAVAEAIDVAEAIEAIEAAEALTVTPGPGIVKAPVALAAGLLTEVADPTGVGAPAGGQLAPEGAEAPRPGLLRRFWRAAATRWIVVTGVPVTAVLAIAAFLRFWHLASIGFNSDEAVYAGTAASIAGDDTLRSMFPIFRAHPVLFQLIVSLGFHGGVNDWAARAFSAGFGVACVALTYALGRRLYGHPAALMAALLLAVMPYHVTVSRQVLLDGLMTLCATAVVYCIVRYAQSTAFTWLLAAGGLMGVTVLAKETSIILLGGLYAFFALAPGIRVRLWHLLLSFVAMLGVIAVHPVVLTLAGRSSAGQSFVLWQLFRRANHEWWFYGAVVPPSLGIATLVAAAVGLVWLRRENTWRERLLLAWIAVPVVFFTLWPVKGYQYLLPIAPVLAVLAGRAVARLAAFPPLRTRPALRALAASTLVVATAASLALPAWRVVNPSTSGTFLAGSGGLPGGREAGDWIKHNVPQGAQLLATGPSMANVLQFYGRRRVFALSVSPDPRYRNPAYVPVANPDRAVRDGEFQYIVLDSYSNTRAAFFAEKARNLIDTYHGVAVYTSAVTVATSSGNDSITPVIVIYEVHAS